MNRSVLIASCAFLMQCSSSALAEPARPTIATGGDRAYPPYEFLDHDGKPAGFNVELTYAIAEVAGLTVEIRLGTWDAMRQALARGELDAMEGVIHSPGREPMFDFSPPHSTIHQSVFGRLDAAPVTDLAQLRGKEVIVQRGGIMHDYLVENHVGATLILVETHVAAMRLLASGKHDYALVANLPGLYLGREYGLHNIRSVGKLFGGQPYGYAVRKGNTELLARLSEGLAIVKHTGRYQEIYNRWLGSLEPSGVLPANIIEYGLLVVVPLLLVIGGTVLWSRTLQRRVLARTDELKLRHQQLLQADRLASRRADLPSGYTPSRHAHPARGPSSRPRPRALACRLLKASACPGSGAMETAWPTRSAPTAAFASRSRTRSSSGWCSGACSAGWCRASPSR